MTVKTFRDRLSSDADYAISFMVDNNFEAIADNLRTGYGAIIESDDDVFEALNEMKAERRYRDIVRVLSVPVITDDLDPAVLGVLQEVGRGMRQVAKAKSGGDNDLSGNDDNSGASDVNGNGTTGGNADGSGSGWSDIFGSIVSGFTAIWSSTHDNENLTNVSTSPEVQLAAQHEAERKARTTRIIIISVVVVIAIVGAWLAWKKWGK